VVKKLNMLWNLQRKLNNININCKPIRNPLQSPLQSQKKAQKITYRFFGFWPAKTEPKPVGLGWF
jgi:hypothetical protein